MTNLDLTVFQNKKIGLIGAGVETYSLAKFLNNYEIKPDLLVLDSDKVNDFKELTENIYSGENYLDQLNKYDLLVRSPGYPLFKLKQELKTVNSGAEISSAIKLFFKICPAKIVGVTGTKGKGTTSSLIYEILKASGKDVYLAGNIGSGPFDFLDKLNHESIVVLELSSFQLEDLDQSPQIGVVLEISPDHLKPLSLKSPNYHLNIEDYIASKTNLISHQKNDGWAIVNIDHTFSKRVIESIKSNKLFISRKNKTEIFIQDDKIICSSGKQTEFGFKNRFIKGDFNLYNIAAAVGVAMILEIDPITVNETINEFKGLPHRMQFIMQKSDIAFYDDSYATGPQATMAAIESFSQDIALILGGSSKGVDFGQLATTIKNSSVKYISLIGQEAQNIAKSLDEVGFNQYQNFNQDFESAVKTAITKLSGKGVVLLSPACASTDMFTNASNRGDNFIQIVKDGEVNGIG